MINYDKFRETELKTAKIIEAERVEGSEKLIRLQLDMGAGENRQIVAGIGLKYSPDDLIGKTIVVVANLEPRKLMGLESNGMLLAASNETEGPALLTTMEEILPGSEIK